MSLSEGSRLGPYEVLERLGEGGVGEVFRARDPRLDRDVAIKILPPHVAADDAARKRFEQEAKAVAAISHPNIVAIHDVGRDGDVSYVVIELLEGETLRDRLRQGALPVSTAVDYALQITSGLGAAHERGVVHRDIKPENLFVTRRGRVKILDFGSARQAIPKGPEEATLPAEAKSHSSGFLLGTVPYMSPEQVRGLDVDARSDLFSLGIVLYEMLAGQRPFRGDYPVATMQAIVQQDPPSLSEANPRVPPVLERIVGRCLEKTPAQRFHSAHDLGLALETVSLSQSTPQQSPVSQTDVAAPPATSESSPAIAAGPSGATPAEISGAIPVPSGAPAPVVSGGARWLRIALGAIALLAVTTALGVLTLRWLGTQGTSGAGAADAAPTLAERTRLAVLPCSNLSGDDANAVFSDGITEDLVAQLSQIGSLRVVSPLSARAYADSDLPSREIAQQLGVGTLVRCTARRSGDDIRVGIQVIDPATDELLWSNVYDRQLTDVFAIQSEVAREVAASLQATLDPDQVARLESAPTESTEAWELYQRGHRFLEKRAADDMEAALDYFQGALIFDSDFAHAHAGLAEALLLLENHGVRPRDEVYPQARQALDRALELDPRLPDAWVALGWLLHTEYKWDEARAAFERAIEINPSHATAHRWFGLMLGGEGKYDEAIEQMEAALQADPLSAMVRGNLAKELTWAGRYEEALTHLEAALAREPDHALAHQFLAELYWHRGLLEQAHDAARTSYELAPRNPTAEVYLRCIEIEMGQSPEPARALLERLLAQAGANAVLKASLLVHLGETDEAFRWLDRAIDEKDSNVILLRQTIGLRPIFDDPRFEQLFARMGLEPPPTV